MFSKYHGNFVSKDKCSKQICQKIVFGKFMKNESEDNICSVCLDSTKTKTPCGHTLCIPCWQKLKNNKCPLCRGSISYFQNNEDEEDDENENET